MDWDLILFGVVFVAVVGGFGFKMIRHGGLRGGLFGGRLIRSYGEVSGRGSGPLRVRIRVHSVAASDYGRPDVGIEIEARSFMSWQMFPVKLGRQETLELIKLLEKAAAVAGGA